MKLQGRRIRDPSVIKSHDLEMTKGIGQPTILRKSFLLLIIRMPILSILSNQEPKFPLPSPLENRMNFFFSVSSVPLGH